ncbi:alpha/beta-hydrolase [Pholiota conissans]|uniref:Alpha/beta-hydrolase n=1 Tax=Pholiota conissans TaxID=109636 RepID=A0A9P6CPH0_9AGAR|nr:alpha/beta-hydrolase [Pholiota conissans]
MTSTDIPLGKSRVVPGRYPPPGTDPYADAIRERRGARGLTPLDANLLHVPAIAGGYNTMMGAIRTGGKLPGDIREAMILRVAAINRAAFEWIQHEGIGRKEGLSIGQLYIIRDTETPLPPSPAVLNGLQSAAVAYTDYSTRDIRVPMTAIQEFKDQLKIWAVSANPSMTTEEIEAKTDDLYVEAVMVVSAYNMVSRFLVATDVAGLSDVEVPWPVDKKEHVISLPVFPPASGPQQTIHAIALITSPSAPWLVFMNSLLTDLTMWNYVVTYFLDLPSSGGKTYNILLHSQRGHGLSTLPPEGETQERLATIPLLAKDVVALLETLWIPTPVHSVIGVSQGGAAALAFAAEFADKTKSIVACDTAPRTPAGNKDAWEDRIRLVHGGSEAPHDANQYAKNVGMNQLAKVTVPRWFPAGSSCGPSATEGEARARWVENMITKTDVTGFVNGARALGDYDILNPTAGVGCLFDSSIARVLLLAGSLDGGGKVGKGLQELCGKWNEYLKAEGRTGTEVEFAEIENAGHLPMIDSPSKFCDRLGSWLASF